MLLQEERQLLGEKQLREEHQEQGLEPEQMVSFSDRFQTHAWKDSCPLLLELRTPNLQTSTFLNSVCRLLLRGERSGLREFPQPTQACSAPRELHTAGTMDFHSCDLHPLHPRA